MWQPIETAPKDGSWFLVTGSCDLVEIRCWRFGKFDGVYSTWRGSPYIKAPTHWMPLPEPPQ